MRKKAEQKCASAGHRHCCDERASQEQGSGVGGQSVTELEEERGSCSVSCHDWVKGGFQAYPAVFRHCYTAC